MTPTVGLDPPNRDRTPGNLPKPGPAAGESYRFLHSGKVAAEDILQPHREALLEGCRLHGTVLLAPDSTTLNNTALGASTSGLGALQERCSRAGVGDVRARGGGFHRRRPAAGGERAMIGAFVERRQLRPAAERGKPFGTDICSYERRGADVGVDERSPSDTGTLSDSHVVEIARVQPAMLGLWVVHVERQVLARDAGIVLGLPCPSAFEHENALARLGEAAGSDRTAESASDDDCVEVRHSVFSLSDGESEQPDLGARVVQRNSLGTSQRFRSFQLLSSVELESRFARLRIDADQGVRAVCEQREPLEPIPFRSLAAVRRARAQHP